MDQEHDAAPGNVESPDETMSAEALPASSRVKIADLRFGSSPRLGGADSEHALLLVGIVEPLPPILVDRQTMTVIDGMHRVLAARLRGDRDIAVELFDGSPEEAYIQSVKANIAHGKPLTLKERKLAAARILAIRAAWSDRVIAEICGLSPKTVAVIRRQATVEPAQSRGRMGRDGRMRPLDSSTARQRTAELIQAAPSASLRSIARQVGLSVGTVRDVHARVVRGEPPVPSRSRLSTSNGSSGNGCSAERGAATSDSENPPPGPALEHDRAYADSESRRSFASWFDAHAIDAEDWRRFLDEVPLNRVYEVSDEARFRAATWRDFAAALERRPLHAPTARP